MQLNKQTYTLLDPLRVETTDTPPIKQPIWISNGIITLEGRLDSDLKWREAKSTAQHYISQKIPLFWAIDLGLFSHVRWPLSDETQHLALKLAVRQFCDTLWKEFANQTVGVSFYCGSLDFTTLLSKNNEHSKYLHEWLEKLFLSETIFCEETGINTTFTKITTKSLHATLAGQWLLQLFYRDLALDYFDSFARECPGELNPCLLFDIGSILDPVLLALLLSRERFSHFCRGITSGVLPASALTTEPCGYIAQISNETPSWNSPSLGIYLPALERYRPSQHLEISSAVNKLMKKQIPFRFVSEATLTTEWDGLDHIAVLTTGINNSGLRKLRGFCAAGGSLLFLDYPLGLPEEAPFNEWMRTET